MSLVKMSLSGAVLIIVITIIRALAVNRLPKKTFLALWTVVLMRLLIPFSFSSALSVYTLFERHSYEAEAFVTPMTVHALASTIPMRAQADSLPVWTLVWGMGVLLCGLYFVTAYWKYYKEFQTSFPVDHPAVQSWLKDHPLKRTISIRQSSQIEAPLTYGILQPVILMPGSTNWENEDALQYVLAHEYTHIQRFDAVFKLILTAGLCIHWFNPLVWVMFILANRDIELACDETVIHRFGENARASYARVLVSMEETKSRGIPFCSSFSKNAIEERIVAIMKTRKLTALSLTAGILIVAATATAFATSATLVENKPNSITEYSTKSLSDYESSDDSRVLLEGTSNSQYFDPGIVWWTYEEYKDWLENEKKELQEVIGQKAWAGGEEFIWTQEIVDETIAVYEEILQQIKDGVLVSKTVDGNPNLMVSYDPGWTVTTQTHSMLITLTNGEEYLIGEYQTQEELLEEVENFCQMQVELGNMEASEAEEIIGQCSMRE